jgi:hypothetical protein
VKEYFITTNSFAAPFFSDSGDCFQKANTPEEALKKVANAYTHPAGLYAAVCYASAEDYHKNRKPLAKWICNHELEKQKITKGGCHSYLGHAPGDFEIDGKRHKIANPKGGKVVKC